MEPYASRAAVLERAKIYGELASTWAVIMTERARRSDREMGRIEKMG